MPITGKYFPSQKPEEKVFLLLRRHWFTYAAFLFIALIMSLPLWILLIYWLINPNTFTPIVIDISIIASSAYLLFIMAVLLFGFIDYYLDVYIVTNERIVDIEQNGFFQRKISELHLNEVQDVNAQVKGMFPTFLHYGDIHIQTAGERENFIFKSVPNPYRVSKTIVDLHEEIIEAGLGELKETIDEAGEIQTTKMAKTAKIPKGKRESDFVIDLPTASLARKRTKNFLKGGALEETDIGVEKDLGNEIKQKLKSEKSMNLLNNINKSRTKVKKGNLNTKSKMINSPNQEKEMRENEEIDL